MRKVWKIFSWSWCWKSWKITWTLNDLLLLPERIKLEKVEKGVTNLCNQNDFVMHIRNLKQALNHGLIFKKVPRLNFIKKLG